MPDTVEVLHYRDPDGECEIRVWVNGDLVAVHEEDVDPGRGHELAEWDEQTGAIDNNPSLSLAFRGAVHNARNVARDSEYVKESY
jgi:hypothetical protein